MSDLKSLTAALSLTASITALALATSPVMAQERLGADNDNIRAPSSEMLDPGREGPADSGAESHERMAQTGRPDVRAGESIEDAREDARKGKEKEKD
jgi:hypothetical protein